MNNIIVTSKDENQRIDKFIKKYLANAPLSLIYKLFRKKDIKVNNKRVTIDYVIKENDEVSIYLGQQDLKEFIKKKPLIKEKANLDIIYEDSNVLIVNKHSGLLVHQDSNEDSKTLNNQILNYLYNKGEYHEDDIFTPSAVHRLDRNTAGIIITAKNLKSSQTLSLLFQDKKMIDTEYLAIVKGKTNEQGKINSKLSKIKNTNIVKIDEYDGLNASTIYEKIIDNDLYSLLKIKILTGRSHQIRVHLSSLGHPVINDDKYGDTYVNKNFKNKYHYPYQLLFANKIVFKKIDGHLSYLSNKIFNASIDSKIDKIIQQEFHFKIK